MGKAKSHTILAKYGVKRAPFSSAAYQMTNASDFVDPLDSESDVEVEEEEVDHEEEPGEEGEHVDVHLDSTLCSMRQCLDFPLPSCSKATEGHSRNSPLSKQRLAS